MWTILTYICVIYTCLLSLKTKLKRHEKASKILLDVNSPFTYQIIKKAYLRTNTAACLELTKWLLHGWHGICVNICIVKVDPRNPQFTSYSSWVQHVVMSERLQWSTLIFAQHRGGVCWSEPLIRNTRQHIHDENMNVWSTEHHFSHHELKCWY